jgi:aquaporin Z
VKKYLAELVGTFVFVFIGGMSVLGAVAMNASPLLVAPFGFGLGLLAAIWLVGHVSSGYFNPAVTTAMVLDKRMPMSDFGPYVLAQLVGATLAGYAVHISSWGSDERVGQFLNNGPGMRGNETAALIGEILLTMIFVGVILVVTKRSSAVPGVIAPALHPTRDYVTTMVISFTLVAVHFAGVGFSGSSVNPARSLGPAIVAIEFGSIWVYIVGPLVGAVLAWQLVKLAGTEDE